MHKALVLVLAVVACVAEIAQSAAIARADNWRVNMLHSSTNPRQTVTAWFPSLASKRVFHPAPEPDEEYVLSPKRRQVNCKQNIL